MQLNPAILAAQPFLKGLSAQQIELLADNAMPAEFKTGELIFKERQSGQPLLHYFERRSNAGIAMPEVRRRARHGVD